MAVNPQDGTRRPLASDATLSYVEAALGYKRGETELFTNLPAAGVRRPRRRGRRRQNGIMHFPDLPVLATLLGANLRRGRNVAAFDAAAALKVYQEQAPPPGSTPDSRPAFGQTVKTYTNRKPIGTAALHGRPFADRAASRPASR